MQPCLPLQRCNWPKLKDLDVGTTTIGAAAVQALSKGQWPNLEVLTLGENDMTDMAGLVQANWPHLKTLYLGMAYLSEDSMKDLVRRGFSALEMLDLSHCFFPDKGLTVEQCSLASSQGFVIR